MLFITHNIKNYSIWMLNKVCLKNELKDRPTICNLALELYVVIQNILMTFWIARIHLKALNPEAIYFEATRGVSGIILAILIIIAELLSKACSFYRKESTHEVKKLLICFSKFCALTLLQALFLNTLSIILKDNIEPSYFGTFLILHLVINYLLTVMFLSIGYFHVGYLTFNYFLSLIVMEVLIFRQFSSDNSSQQSGNVLPMIFCLVLVLVLLAKISNSNNVIFDNFLNYIKDSSLGVAIIKKSSLVFVSESARKFFKCNEFKTLKTEDLSSFVYNRYLRLKENKNIPFVNSEHETVFKKSSPHFVRRILNLSEILEILKRAPDTTITVYTRIDYNSDARKERRDTEEVERFKRDETDMDLPVKGICQFEVKFSYLNWGKFQDEYVMVQFKDITETQVFLELERDLEFKTDILNSFSHELKTPLHISKNILEVMINDEGLPKIFKEKYISVVNSSLMTLNYLIHDIVDFLKIETHQLELELSKFSIKGLLKDILKILDERARESSIQLLAIYEDEDDWTLFTDHSKLKRILRNVLLFVIKTSKHCLIEIRVKPNRIGSCDLIINKKESSDSHLGMQMGNLEISTSILKRTLVIVPEKDFSITISRVLLEKLLDNGIEDYLILNNEGEPCLQITFSQFNEELLENWSISQKLSSNNKIFGSHSDYIDAGRDYDHYTPFPKSLHYKENNISENIRKTRLENPDCPRILIVDDDPFNILSLAMILEKLKINTIKASNGQEAIITYKNFQVEHKCGKAGCKGIEIILMDLMMPIMNGMESAVILLKMMEDNEVPLVPIIAFSANDAKDITTTCQKIGFKHFISKPLNMNNLKAVLRKFLV